MKLKRIIAAAAGLAIAAAAISMAAGPAYAQRAASIISARQAGLIGERSDGYLGFVSTPSAALRRQVETVNITRRALYTNLAQRRGVTPSEVGITAACQLLAGVGVGEYYMLADGVWRRRAPGQSAPVPNYCV